MQLHSLINSFWLITDIIWAILLFKYWLPEEISRSGSSYLICEQNNPDEIKKAKKYDFYGKIWLWLLILWFILQLISNFIPN